jgi:hypothetical protein
MNHLGALRVSLLLAIGVVPVACGGTVRNGDGDDETSGSGGSAGSKTAATGGKPTNGTGGSVSGAGGPGKMLPPTGGTGAGGGAVSFPPVCSNPRYDPVSGLGLCDEGYKIRSKAIRCEGFSGIAGADQGSGGAGGQSDELPRTDGSVLCRDFAEGGASAEDVCLQFENGYCDSLEGQSPTCQSGCITDQDCGANALCECGHAESPTGGVCRYATCRGGEDCRNGAVCASFAGICGSGGFACFAVEDECTTNEDCLGATCTYDRDRQLRYCERAVCGRPFLVDHDARVAPVVNSSAWSDAVTPCVDHLSSAERAALAEHWTRLGQLEHASIAAFARFNLQLLSLGAPPELVEACIRALRDETAHTQLCFGIASAYAGRAIGPGKLDIDGSLGVTSLVEVVELVIFEGCFGETVAALEAREAAETAADPVIRSAYAQIAADEQRHAELAFRFIRWALEQDRAGVSDCIEAALHTTVARTDVLRAVVEPCFAALLAQAA